MAKYPSQSHTPSERLAFYESNDKFLYYPAPNFLHTEISCKLWQGNKINNYGNIGFKGESWLLHRFVWILVYNLPLWDGLEFNHICRRKSCAEITHLEVVPHSYNMKYSYKDHKQGSFKSHRKDKNARTDLEWYEILDDYFFITNSLRETARKFSITPSPLNNVISGRNKSGLYDSWLDSRLPGMAA